MGNIVPVRISLMISSASARSQPREPVGAAFSARVGQGLSIGVQVKGIGRFG